MTRTSKTNYDCAASFSRAFCRVSLLILYVFYFSATAQFASADLAPHIEAKLVLDQDSIQPPSDPKAPTARIGVLLKIEPGWHTYWRNSGEAAVPVRVTWQLPDEWKAGDLHWPLPNKFLERGNITTYGYRTETLLWSDLYIPAGNFQEGKEVHLAAKVSWLVCKEICVPGTQTVELKVPFSNKLAVGPSADLAAFEKYCGTEPNSIEGLKKKERFKNFSIVTAVEPNKDDRQRATVHIQLNNVSVAGIENPAANLQLFPYKQTALITQSPVLDRGGSADSPSLILKTPIQLLMAPTEGKLTFSGLIAVSKELTGGTHDYSFEFEVPLESADGGFKASEPIPQSSGNFHEPLTLRSMDTVVEKAQKPKVPPVPVEPAADLGLIQALLAAFLAGLILNLMPCVLPIISIKILGFVEQSKQDRKSVLISALTFAAGILSSFFVIAVLLISLRSGGQSLGWGFQFQYPQFVAALLLIVFFLSLALFDFYTVNLPFMQSANKAASEVSSPLLRNFFDGVLATALATPCTAPILGTALVFAFAQPPIFTILVFLTIGLGLALPYVYFATHPRFLNMLPTPGNWMYHFRQVMGFLLLGTCCWLLSVLHDLTDKGDVWAVMLMLILFFCLWVRKVSTESKPERGRAPLFNLIFFGALIGSAYLTYPSMVLKRGTSHKGRIPWTAYSQAVVDEAGKQGQTVFIDFTASWCITCKFNEYRIIETQETAEAIKRNHVLAVKADWTGGDEEITKALQSFGAEGVPLYVVLPPDHSKAVVLSTLPAQSSLLEALSVK